METENIPLLGLGTFLSEVLMDHLSEIGTCVIFNIQREVSKLKVNS